MRVTSNTEELLQSITKVKEELKKKLEGMVEKFSYHVAMKAIDNTPYGSLINPETGEINQLYSLPSRTKFFPLELPGQAKGGWLLSFDEYKVHRFGAISDESGTQPKLAAEINAKEYKLGEDIWLLNNVPYVATSGWSNPKFGSLEGGYSDQAPEGIKGPTLENIMQIYSADIKNFFDQS